MTMDDLQFMDSFKRKKIKLTLKTATFLGVVQRINLNKTVVLEEVVDVQSGKQFPGVKLFFGHEILNVEFPHSTKSDKGETKDGEQNPEGFLTVAEFQPYRKSLILDDDDENDESSVNFVVIDEFHEKFGPAVMHIRKQQVIGLGSDGVGAFQHERLCWLQIATKNKVYLFDILLLGARAFKNGLSMILENNHILKVTHDCRGMAGCLMAQFGVNLSNVFDTQVADVLCFYAETGGFLPDRVSALQEVVSLHLKMPLSRLGSLGIKSLLTKEDKEVWYMRPCPAPLLKVMALSVIHLQPLRLVLLDTLMADYTGLVDAYLNGSREEPVHIHTIGISSVLELPRELRELEHMRRERQEWAMQRYPVTEQGLLDRSNPRPLPQTTLPAEVQISTEGPPAMESLALGSAPGPQSTVDALQPNNIQIVPDLHGGPPILKPATQASEPKQILRKQLSSPMAPAGGAGLMEIVKDTMGRGRPLQKVASPFLPAFPSLGRGLFFQAPEENPGAALKTLVSVERVEVAPTGPSPSLRPSPAQGAVAPSTTPTALPGLGRGQFIHNPKVLSSPLSLSFSSFRNT